MFRYIQTRGISPLLQTRSVLSSPGQKSAVKPRRHDAEVVELAVSTGDLRSFPDSNNKIEQTGRRDAVCKSERCWVKGWGRTECFWLGDEVMGRYCFLIRLLLIYVESLITPRWNVFLSLPFCQMSICTAGCFSDQFEKESVCIAHWICHNRGTSECNVTKKTKSVNKVIFSDLPYSFTGRIFKTNWSIHVCSLLLKYVSSVAAVATDFQPWIDMWKTEIWFIFWKINYNNTTSYKTGQNHTFRENLLLIWLCQQGFFPHIEFF